MGDTRQKILAGVAAIVLIVAVVLLYVNFFRPPAQEPLSEEALQRDPTNSRLAPGAPEAYEDDGQGDAPGAQ